MLSLAVACVASSWLDQADHANELAAAQAQAQALNQLALGAGENGLTCGRDPAYLGRGAAGENFWASEQTCVVTLVEREAVIDKL